MSTITVKLPEDLDARLEAEADSRRVSKSQVVREALVSALNRSSTQEAPSAYNAMKGACGIVDDGPPDLSTNKEHLRNYGK